MADGAILSIRLSARASADCPRRPAKVGVIARSLGLRVKALKAIESDEESADGAALYCLASMFRVPVAFFFDGLPAVTDAAAQPDPAPRARELVKLLNIYASLPDKRLRKTLIELIGSVVQENPESLIHAGPPSARHMAPAGFSVYNHSPWTTTPSAPASKRPA